MGVKDYNVNKKWDLADPSALVPRAAAFLNKDRHQLAIDVAIGVDQSKIPIIQNAEVNNAFSAAAEANQLYPKTVWGLVFTNEYITNDNEGIGKGEKVLGMMRYEKKRAMTANLRIGTRINICGVMLTDKGSKLYNILRDIAGESDFIMCNMYPDKDVVHNGVKKAVEAVGNFYLAVRKEFQSINSKIDVIIGETGWPDAGESFNESPNNVENLKHFWYQMANWASRNAVRTYIFEAMDEPWKTGWSAETHYGWWKRQDNAAEVYVEKATGQQVKDYKTKIHTTQIL